MTASLESATRSPDVAAPARVLPLNTVGRHRLASFKLLAHRVGSTRPWSRSNGPHRHRSASQDWPSARRRTLLSRGSEASSSIGHVLELVSVRGHGEGDLKTALLLEVQSRQRLVERLHSVLFLARLHRRVDLVNLILSDEVSDSGIRHQNLHGEGSARPARLRQQGLAHDALEHERKLCSDLRLLVRWKDVDDAVDRLGGGVSMKRREGQMAGLRDTQAASMVSRSRISPMSTTSGSSRRADRSALVKLWVSACISRWLTKQRW